MSQFCYDQDCFAGEAGAAVGDGAGQYSEGGEAAARSILGQPREEGPGSRRCSPSLRTLVCTISYHISATSAVQTVSDAPSASKLDNESACKSIGVNHDIQRMPLVFRRTLFKVTSVFVNLSETMADFGFLVQRDCRFCLLHADQACNPDHIINESQHSSI